MPLWNIINLILSVAISAFILVAMINLIFNLVLLYKYRNFSFFGKRNIKLLIFTIIPPSIEIFILIPLSVVSFNYLLNSDYKSINLQILLHTTCMNVWICAIFTRIWYVFAQIKKQQDSLEWKKVCFFLF